MDPVAKFWSRLHNEVVDKLVSDPDQFLLRHMRFDHDMVREYQKRFGHIWKEYGTDIFQLIAEAHGEIWDAEDDGKQQARRTMEKSVPLESKENPVENAIQVGAARKIGVREGQGQGHDVPPGDGRREVDVQEGGQGS